MKAPYGYVYFIQVETYGPIKIGIAENPEKRLGGLQSGNPDRLYIRALIRSEEPRRLESDLHAKFAQHRLGGEWFSPVPTLLAFIEEEGKRDAEVRARADARTAVTERAATHVAVLEAMDTFLSGSGRPWPSEAPA